MRAPSGWRVGVLALATLASAGCFEPVDAYVTPIPQEAIDMGERQTAAGMVRLVGFRLDAVTVGVLFDGEFDAARADAALGELGFTRLGEGAWSSAAANASLSRPHADWFWLNLTYIGFAAHGETLEDAQEAANSEWPEREAVFMATMAAFGERTGWWPASPPQRTDTYAAVMGRSLA